MINTIFYNAFFTITFDIVVALKIKCDDKIKITKSEW